MTSAQSSETAQDALSRAMDAPSSPLVSPIDHSETSAKSLILGKRARAEGDTGTDEGDKGDDEEQPDDMYDDPGDQSERRQTPSEASTPSGSRRCSTPSSLASGNRNIITFTNKLSSRKRLRGEQQADMLSFASVSVHCLYSSL